MTDQLDSACDSLDNTNFQAASIDDCDIYICGSSDYSLQAASSDAVWLFFPSASFNDASTADSTGGEGTDVSPIVADSADSDAGVHLPPLEIVLPDYDYGPVGVSSDESPRQGGGTTVPSGAESSEESGTAYGGSEQTDHQYDENKDSGCEYRAGERRADEIGSDGPLDFTHIAPDSLGHAETAEQPGAPFLVVACAELPEPRAMEVARCTVTIDLPTSSHQSLPDVGSRHAGKESQLTSACLTMPAETISPTNSGPECKSPKLTSESMGHQLESQPAHRDVRPEPKDHDCTRNAAPKAAQPFLGLTLCRDSHGLVSSGSDGEEFTSTDGRRTRSAETRNPPGRLDAQDASWCITARVDVDRSITPELAHSDDAPAAFGIPQDECCKVTEAVDAARRLTMLVNGTCDPARPGESGITSNHPFALRVKRLPSFEIVLPVYVCETAVIDGKPRRLLRKRLVRIEREMPGVELLIAALATVAAMRKADSSEQDLSVSEPTKRLSKAVRMQRARLSVRRGEDLVRIGEQRYGDSMIGWLILSINSHCITQTWQDGKCIAELRLGQMIELPGQDDIARFRHRRLICADPLTLITLVTQASIDREYMNRVLSVVVGAAPIGKERPVTRTAVSASVINTEGVATLRRLSAALDGLKSFVSEQPVSRSGGTKRNQRGH